MIPTEDLVDLLHEEGIETGIDLDLLIEAAHLAEQVVGHELYGKVTKAGPRPRGERLYPMDMPFVESIDQAQHFRQGPSAYDGAPSPYREPISSPARDAVEAGQPVPLAEHPPPPRPPRSPMDLLVPSVWERAIFSGGWVPASASATSPSPPPAPIRPVRSRRRRCRRRCGGRTRRTAGVGGGQLRARATVLRRAAQAFVDHADEIAELRPRGRRGAHGGRGRRRRRRRGVLRGGRAGGDAVGRGAALPSPTALVHPPAPVGVVGVIAPFNAPIMLAVRSIAPALALGNAVVLKPDPRTAVCGGAVFAEVFDEAGLPEGLLHVLPGGADVGEALVQHPDVPVIAFTGSTSGGKAIARRPPRTSSASTSSSAATPP